MESDSDSIYEENSSDEEQEGAGPININVEVNLEEPPEVPEVGPPSPVPPPPILEQELAPGWELPDDGNNFINFFTRTDVIELKNWAHETRARVNEPGYFVEAPVISQNFAEYSNVTTFSKEWKIWPKTRFLVLALFVGNFSNKHHYNLVKILRIFCFWYFCLN